MNLPRHEEACAKRPADDALYTDVDAGMTQTQLGRKYGVNRRTVYRWLLEAKILKLGRHAHERLVVHPGYAPMLTDKNTKCPCAAIDVCERIIEPLGWVLCEAPDDGQLEAWKRDGFDVLQFTTELWAERPELWNNGKGM